MRLLTLLARVSAALLLPASGCESPVEDDLIASLGEEVPGVPEGPFHRYGQPCTACHGGPNTDAPLFVAAGTVFATPDDNIPVANVNVRITDAIGNSYVRGTNCAGNFYLAADEEDVAAGGLVFPLRAEISCPLPDGRMQRSVMGTRISREGGCNACHLGDASATSAGRIFCNQRQPDPPFAIDPACPGGPQ